MIIAQYSEDKVGIQSQNKPFPSFQSNPFKQKMYNFVVLVLLIIQKNDGVYPISYHKLLSFIVRNYTILAFIVCDVFVIALCRSCLYHFFDAIGDKNRI